MSSITSVKNPNPYNNAWGTPVDIQVINGVIRQVNELVRTADHREQDAANSIKQLTAVTEDLVQEIRNAADKYMDVDPPDFDNLPGTNAINWGIDLGQGNNSNLFNAQGDKVVADMTQAFPLDTGGATDFSNSLNAIGAATAELDAQLTDIGDAPTIDESFSPSAPLPQRPTGLPGPVAPTVGSTPALEPMPYIPDPQINDIAPGFSLTPPPSGTISLAPLAPFTGPTAQVTAPTTPTAPQLTTALPVLDLPPAPTIGSVDLTAKTYSGETIDLPSVPSIPSSPQFQALVAHLPGPFDGRLATHAVQDAPERPDALSATAFPTQLREQLDAPGPLTLAPDIPEALRALWDAPPELAAEPELAALAPAPVLGDLQASFSDAPKLPDRPVVGSAPGSLALAPQEGRVSVPDALLDPAEFDLVYTKAADRLNDAANAELWDHQFGSALRGVGEVSGARRMAERRTREQLRRDTNELTLSLAQSELAARREEAKFLLGLRLDEHYRHEQAVITRWQTVSAMQLEQWARGAATQLQLYSTATQALLQRYQTMTTAEQTRANVFLAHQQAALNHWAQAATVQLGRFAQLGQTAVQRHQAQLSVSTSQADIRAREQAGNAARAGLQAEVFTKEHAANMARATAFNDAAVRQHGANIQGAAAEAGHRVAVSQTNSQTTLSFVDAALRTQGYRQDLARAQFGAELDAHKQNHGQEIQRLTTAVQANAGLLNQWLAPVQQALARFQTDVQARVGKGGLDVQAATAQLNADIEVQAQQLQRFQQTLRAAIEVFQSRNTAAVSAFGTRSQFISAANQAAVGLFSAEGTIFGQRVDLALQSTKISADTALRIRDLEIQARESDRLAQDTSVRVAAEIWGRDATVQIDRYRADIERILGVARAQAEVHGIRAGVLQTHAKLKQAYWDIDRRAVLSAFEIEYRGVVDKYVAETNAEGQFIRAEADHQSTLQRAWESTNRARSELYQAKVEAVLAPITARLQALSQTVGLDINVKDKTFQSILAEANATVEAFSKRADKETSYKQVEIDWARSRVAAEAKRAEVELQQRLKQLEEHRVVVQSQDVVKRVELSNANAKLNADLKTQELISGLTTNAVKSASDLYAALTAAFLQTVDLSLSTGGSYGRTDSTSSQSSVSTTYSHQLTCCGDSSSGD
jgi:hypothetical protein